MHLALDHVAFGWSALDDATDRFADLGLEPEYGGSHADGTTHMAVLGFDDGSYLEVVAPTDSDEEPVRWPAHLRDDAGPVAWCVEVPDAAAAAKRAIDAGLAVRGPSAGGRERPDGTRVEWDSVVLGGPAEFQLLPFCIADRTPREYRVSPSKSVAGGPISGVGEVVVAVADLDPAVELFRRAFRLPTPRRTDHAGFGATLARFPGRPVTLAEPLGSGAGPDADSASWLTDRLDRYPAGPCSYLLATDDLAAAGDSHPLADPEPWGDTRVARFDADWTGRRLGVVERPPSRR